MTKAFQPLPFCLVFLGLGALTSFGQEENAIPEEETETKIQLPELDGATVRNPYFEVVADDRLSAQYVANIGELLASRLSRMIGIPGGISRPILVNLVSASRQEMSTGFFTRLHSSGQVTLSISWSEQTTRELVERALAQAHLTYLSGAYSAGTIHVPLWLELAGQHLARVQAVPAHAHYLAGQVMEAGPMRLERILEAERADDRDDEIAPHAYWLLAFLDREARSRGQLQNYLIRLLRGEAPLPAAAATYGEQLRSPSEAEVWWMVGVRELLRSPRSPMPSAAESRERVRELGRFTFEAEEETVRLYPEDLWKHRSSPNLQSEVRRRATMARMELASVHPFYHNVLLSLQRVFQAVLEGDAAEFNRAAADLRHDLRTGDELAEDTDSVLDDLDAELRSR